MMMMMLMVITQCLACYVLPAANALFILSVHIVCCELWLLVVVHQMLFDLSLCVYIFMYTEKGSGEAWNFWFVLFHKTVGHDLHCRYLTILRSPWSRSGEAVNFLFVLFHILNPAFFFLMLCLSSGEQMVFLLYLEFFPAIRSTRHESERI